MAGPPEYIRNDGCVYLAEWNDGVEWWNDHAHQVCFVTTYTHRIQCLRHSNYGEPVAVIKAQTDAGEKQIIMGTKWVIQLPTLNVNLILVYTSVLCARINFGVLPLWPS